MKSGSRARLEVSRPAEGGPLVVSEPSTKRGRTPLCLTQKSTTSGGAPASEVCANVSSSNCASPKAASGVPRRKPLRFVFIPRLLLLLSYHITSVPVTPYGSGPRRVPGTYLGGLRFRPSWRVAPRRPGGH